jgi:hypothetical protein
LINEPTIDGVENGQWPAAEHLTLLNTLHLSNQPYMATSTSNNVLMPISGLPQFPALKPHRDHKRGKEFTMFAGTYFNVKIVQTHPGNSCLESLGTNATISRESLRDTTHWMNTINKPNALETGYTRYERDHWIAEQYQEGNVIICSS